MSFYLKPPRGLVNLHTIEDCVQQRLNYYDIIYSNNNGVEVYNINCLIDDSPLDRLGHYLFRLYAYFSASFREAFLENEKKLLLLRLNCYGKGDIKYFLKRTLNHSRECLKENNMHETVKEVYLFLISLCSKMLNRDYLNHIVKESHIDAECEKFTLKGKF